MRRAKRGARPEAAKPQTWVRRNEVEVRARPSGTPLLCSEAEQKWCPASRRRSRPTKPTPPERRAFTLRLHRRRAFVLCRRPRPPGGCTRGARSPGVSTADARSSGACAGVPACPVVVIVARVRPASPPASPRPVAALAARVHLRLHRRRAFAASLSRPLRPPGISPRGARSPCVSPGIPRAASAALSPRPGSPTGSPRVPRPAGRHNGRHPRLATSGPLAPFAPIRPTPGPLTSPRSPPAALPRPVPRADAPSPAADRRPR